MRASINWFTVFSIVLFYHDLHLDSWLRFICQVHILHIFNFNLLLLVNLYGMFLETFLRFTICLTGKNISLFWSSIIMNTKSFFELQKALTLLLTKLLHFAFVSLTDLETRSHFVRLVSAWTTSSKEACCWREVYWRCLTSCSDLPNVSGFLCLLYMSIGLELALRTLFLILDILCILISKGHTRIDITVIWGIRIKYRPTYLLLWTLPWFQFRA